MKTYLIDPADAICVCGHWTQEHGDGGCAGCDAAGLRLALIEHAFSLDEVESSPESIADRSGDPAAWPDYVKDYFKNADRPAGEAAGTRSD